MLKGSKHTEEAKAKARRSHAASEKQFVATAKPTIRDLEWAAGFIEGEGSFNKIGNSAAIQVAQVNPDPLIRLHSLFGGRISLYPRKNPKHQAIWRWFVYGARARGITMTLYSLLSEKRKEQARAILAI